MLHFFGAEMMAVSEKVIEKWTSPRLRVLETQHIYFSLVSRKSVCMRVGEVYIMPMNSIHRRALNTSIALIFIGVKRG
jgi:hypothetical protein